MWIVFVLFAPATLMADLNACSNISGKLTERCIEQCLKDGEYLRSQFDSRGPCYNIVKKDYEAKAGHPASSCRGDKGVTTGNHRHTVRKWCSEL